MEGRCQTCKWAVIKPPPRYHQSWLMCNAVRNNTTLAVIYGVYHDSHQLFVAPDFGCVQWEKRDEA